MAAPLVFAGDPIAIAVHVGEGAILEVVLGLGAGGHGGAIGFSGTGIGRGVFMRSCSIDGIRIGRLQVHGFALLKAQDGGYENEDGNNPEDHDSFSSVSPWEFNPIVGQRKAVFIETCD
jgi:hypothetical protein